MEIGEFHWRGGVYAKRDEYGRVHLRIAAGPEVIAESHQGAEADAQTPVAQSGWISAPELKKDVSLVIPPNEWASIIAHVAKGGEPENYTKAVAFHG